MYKNGPLVLSFTPGPSFSYYKSGVYDDKKDGENWKYLDNQ